MIKITPLPVRAIQHAHEELAMKNTSLRNFWTTVDNYLYAYASDRRYKIKTLALTSDYRSGIISYRGHRLYFYYLNGAMTWEQS